MYNTAGLLLLLLCMSGNSIHLFGNIIYTKRGSFSSEHHHIHTGGHLPTESLIIGFGFGSSWYHVCVYEYTTYGLVVRKLAVGWWRDAMSKLPPAAHKQDLLTCFHDEGPTPFVSLLNPPVSAAHTCIQNDSHTTKMTRHKNPFIGFQVIWTRLTP